MLRTGDKIQDYPSNLITWTCSIIKAQKYGSKACHVSAYGDHSTHPGGNTQICPCSSPAILPHLHLCSIVRDMGQYMHALYNEKHRMHTHACTHTHSRAPHHTEAVGETQSAWLGQLSCEVLYADWTYADPFWFFFLLCWPPHWCLFVSLVCAECC